jgi:hypothetical protein
VFDSFIGIDCIIPAFRPLRLRWVYTIVAFVVERDCNEVSTLLFDVGTGPNPVVLEELAAIGALAL